MNKKLFMNNSMGNSIFDIDQKEYMKSLGTPNSKNKTPQKKDSQSIDTTTNVDKSKSNESSKSKKIPTIEIDRIGARVIGRFDDMNIVWYGRRNAIIWLNYSSLLFNDLNTTLDILKMKSIANFSHQGRDYKWFHCIVNSLSSRPKFLSVSTLYPEFRLCGKKKEVSRYFSS